MLRIQLDQALSLQKFAREREQETCAAGLVFPSGTRAGEPVFTVHGLQEVPNQAYLTRTRSGASLRPEFCTELANQARQARAGIFIAHTHVGNDPLEGFSSIDDVGEGPLAEYFDGRLGAGANYSGVFTASHVHARQLGAFTNHEVALVGRRLVRNNNPSGDSYELHDRQVRAFGQGGQEALANLRVGVVGLGGTGSVVAQQLAHLGVRTFLFIDPDVVEATNLNRLVGASRDDVEQPKVWVAHKLVAIINPEADCVELQGDVADDEVAKALLDMDFVFCCTDSMASRAVLNQLAYQYLIPCIDMGVGIGAGEGEIKYITGRVQMLSAGLPCLVCTEKLDAEQVRREMLSEDQRNADPYIQGATVVQPAVISINSTISSTAVTMFLAAVTGIPAEARMLTYDGIRGTIRAVAMDPRSHCIACSEGGALARAENWRLPTRQGHR